MHSDQASRIRFSTARGLSATGYEPDLVDRLIADQIVPTLRAYEEGVAGISVRAADLTDVEFRTSRRGYAMAEVDDFLDQVTGQLERYESV